MRTGDRKGSKTARIVGLSAFLALGGIFSPSQGWSDETPPLAFKPAVDGGFAWNVRASEVMAYTGTPFVSILNRTVSVGVGYYASQTLRLPGVAVDVDIKKLVERIGGALEYTFPVPVSLGIGAALDLERAGSFLDKVDVLLTARVVRISF